MPTGGRIILGCRDMVKCEAAAREIRGKTLNPHVYARELDLASVRSIRRFAQTINQGQPITCQDRTLSANQQPGHNTVNQ